MEIEIKVPSPGESISEVEIANWFVNDGDIVQKEQEIAEIESDKATLPLLATEGGKIHILKPSGTSVPVGEVVCTINTSESNGKKAENRAVKSTNESPVTSVEQKAEEKPIIRESVKKDKPEDEVQSLTHETKEKDSYSDVKVTPVARKMMSDNNLSVEDIINGLRKLSSREVDAVLNAVPGNVKNIPDSFSRNENRQKMSVLRRKLSQRLVTVKNETAMLTTFNEADMSAVIDLRKKYQEEFVKKFGMKLGFMSIFTKAVSEALMMFPMVNSRIDGEEIVSPDFTDIGIAVQSPKGLMVPIVRNAESLSIAEIEIKIAELAEKARSAKISIEEMSGGTFTITNGGVFGSMMSTPILNPPQSAILGMHNIIERPVAVNGEVVIKPMMYLALSYDHRIIDGKDSVSFLMRIKEIIENPLRLLSDGNDPGTKILNL